MIAALLLAIGIASSTITQTPFLAYDLATSMTHCSRIEYIKMENDDQKNVRYIITFHNLPKDASCRFESIMLEHFFKTDKEGKNNE